MHDKQQSATFPEQYDYDKIKEELVITILEKTLLSVQIYHEVQLQLWIKYECDLHECYRHPEYLNEILKDQHDDLYESIMKSINQQLEIFSDAKSIAKFLQRINNS